MYIHSALEMEAWQATQDHRGQAYQGQLVARISVSSRAKELSPAFWYLTLGKLGEEDIAPEQDSPTCRSG